MFSRLGKTHNTQLEVYFTPENSFQSNHPRPRHASMASWFLPRLFLNSLGTKHAWLKLSVAMNDKTPNPDLWPTFRLQIPSWFILLVSYTRFLFLRLFYLGWNLIHLSSREGCLFRSCGFQKGQSTVSYTTWMLKTEMASHLCNEYTSYILGNLEIKTCDWFCTTSKAPGLDTSWYFLTVRYDRRARREPQHNSLSNRLYFRLPTAGSTAATRLVWSYQC